MSAAYCEDIDDKPKVDHNGHSKKLTTLSNEIENEWHGKMT